MPQLLKNNVSGVLAAELSAVGTSMTLVDASSFPDPGSDYYLCTLAGLDSNGREDKWEIVRVTAKASNTLTITRAQEGTTNRLWPAASAVQMRLTAGSVATSDALATKQDALVSGTSIKTINGTSLLGGGDIVISGGGGVGEDTTTSFTYTYTGVMGMPPTPLPGSGSLFASPTGKERAFNVLFVGGANPDLTGIEFTKLEFVGGTFSPQTMAALTTLSLPALTTVGGNFSPNAMAALTSLSLPALTAVGGNFTPSSMAALTSLSVPVLTTVGGIFNPNAMAALTSLSVPALTTVGSNFNPSSMAALTSLSLPALTAVGGNFTPSSMAALTSLSVPVLTTVGGIFNPNAIAALTSLSLPALTAVGGNFGPSSMAALTSLSVPAIERIGTSVTSGNAIQINSGTGALTTFTLPATLKQVGGTAGNVTITSAALDQTSVDSILIRLAALDDTGGTVAFSNRSVTITGTSAAPSSTGLAAKATLVARGCTVTHN